MNSIDLLLLLLLLFYQSKTSQTFFFPLQTVFFFLTLHSLRHPQSLQKYKEHLKLRKIALSRVTGSFQLKNNINSSTSILQGKKI